MSYKLHSNSMVISQHNHSIIVSLALFAMAFIGTLPETANALCKTYYVAPGGSDTNPGTIDKPFKSIYTAGQKLLPCDTLYLRGGTYSQSGIWLDKGGNASAPVTITAYPGDSAPPVLDGSALTIAKYTFALTLAANYINLSGIEVINGEGGVWMRGSYNTVSYMNIHDNRSIGIRVAGNYNTMDSNQVYRVAMSNYNGAQSNPPAWGYGIGSCVNYNSNATVKGMIIRNNVVHDTWGEGITLFQSDGTLMENNQAYDNWAVNVYISDTYNSTIRNNLAYNTPNNSVGKRANGFTLADEAPLNPNSSNNLIINNMLYNSDVSAYGWTIIPGTYLYDVIIANNTIINGSLLFGKKNDQVLVKNNVIFRDDGGLLASVPVNSGLLFMNNLWSATPTPNAQGFFDVVTANNLGLSFPVNILGKINVTTVTKDYFLPKPGSSVINNGSVLNAIIGVYQVNSVTATPNIGAYPYNPPFSYVPQ
jgi:parallel beta-helix repeat protein